MKIIGKTSRGYLVEASDYELLRCSGHGSFRDVPGWRQTGSYNDGTFQIGTEIKVTDTHDYLAKLRDNEASIRGGSKLLRAMADVIDAGLPTTIVPPVEVVKMDLKTEGPA